MTIKELSEKTGFEIVSGDVTAEVTGGYACDLLSWVIGRAKEGDALVTVMTNVNVIAVAVMADLPCVILTEGVKLDDKAMEKAVSNNIAVLSSPRTTFDTCAILSKAFE
jgi:predicted transcriptional regulator